MKRIRAIIITGTVISVFSIFNEAIAHDDLSFLFSPGIIKNPATVEDYSPQNRKITMVPSIAVSRNGRFWATWYAGITPGEDRNNYVVLATSDDQGDTWEEVLVIDPDGQQTSDGTVYITYDFERRGSQEILMSGFREDDILCGSDIRMLEVFQRRRVISRGGSGNN